MHRCIDDSPKRSSSFVCGHVERFSGPRVNRNRCKSRWLRARVFVRCRWVKFDTLTCQDKPALLRVLSGFAEQSGRSSPRKRAPPGGVRIVKKLRKGGWAARRVWNERRWWTGRRSHSHAHTNRDDPRRRKRRDSQGRVSAVRKKNAQVTPGVCNVRLSRPLVPPHHATARCGPEPLKEHGARTKSRRALFALATALDSFSLRTTLGPQNAFVSWRIEWRQGLSHPWSGTKRLTGWNSFGRNGRRRDGHPKPGGCGHQESHGCKW